MVTAKGDLKLTVWVRLFHVRGKKKKAAPPHTKLLTLLRPWLWTEVTTRAAELTARRWTCASQTQYSRAELWDEVSFNHTLRDWWLVSSGSARMCVFYPGDGGKLYVYQKHLGWHTENILMAAEKQSLISPRLTALVSHEMQFVHTYVGASPNLCK